MGLKVSEIYCLPSTTHVDYGCHIHFVCITCSPYNLHNKCRPFVAITCCLQQSLLPSKLQFSSLYHLHRHLLIVISYGNNMRPTPKTPQMMNMLPFL